MLTMHRWWLLGVELTQYVSLSHTVPLSVTTNQTLMWPLQDIGLSILCLLGREGFKNKQAKQCCQVSG